MKYKTKTTCKCSLRVQNVDLRGFLDSLFLVVQVGPVVLLGLVHPIQKVFPRAKLQ